MTTPRTHFLVVTPDERDPQERDYFEYTVECPGVTDECRKWLECLPGTDGRAALENAYDNGDNEPIQHGLRHKKINHKWMAETTGCYLQDHDALGDAVAGYFAAGRHPIGWDVGDGTELEIHALDSAGRPA
ncbi:hypothetical protein BDK92_7333 [Micromonospora pisi]|uniref:Uncharacterized protein n=1 Tax=Micromonospora pisi TaxID=589240 RepID=A0A495JVI0_9ACTN|nr:hypothetical protein [Micromonospora pisi]RKR92851.1 hypothetical protein BDK92_7333 [Micromonospora pisi]